MNYPYQSDVPIEEVKDIRLTYKQNSFNMDFSTFDYQKANNIYYEYRFTTDGVDVWSRTEPGKGRVSFTHLAPGSYKLQCRASENGNYTPISEWTIRITPPWYKSWWAIVLYVLLALAFIIILFRYLQNKEKEKNNEAKLRFFTDLSHEFRSPITLILSPLEVLLKNEYDSNTTRSLQNMQRNGNRILSLLNQILAIRKIDNGQLLMEYTEVDMVHFLKQFFDIFLYESE